MQIQKNIRAMWSLTGAGILLLTSLVFVQIGSLIIKSGVKIDLTQGSAKSEQTLPLFARQNGLSETETRLHGQEYASGRIIVKFKSLNQSAVLLLAQGKPFQSAGGSVSVDELNRRYGVRAATEVFVKQGSKPITEVRAEAANSLRNIKEKFKERSARAEPGAIPPDLANVYVFELSDGTDAEEASRHYAADPAVEYAHPDFIQSLWLVPNDPYYSSAGTWGQAYKDMWGLHKIQAAAAWDKTQGLTAAGQPIIVAVNDTGVDYNHIDITGRQASNIWKNALEEGGKSGIDDDFNGYVDDVLGWDFGNNDNDPMDVYGHGTHVAGTIAATGNNGMGVVGVAYKSKIMVLKGFANSGAGLSSSLAQGIVYAAKNGADVINNSWGCAYCPRQQVVEDAVRFAYSLGVVNVFAAGNSSSDVLDTSPENMTESKPIVVSATDQDDLPTSFTNYGILNDVAAPGGGKNTPPTNKDFIPLYNILSLKSSTCSSFLCGPTIVGEKYLRLAGTSMAAPHVAGLVALILAQKPTLAVEDVRQIIRSSADDVAAPGFDVKTGAGRINAAKALAIASVPKVRITAPASNTVISPPTDSVVIKGMASGTGFQKYELSFGKGNNPSQWTTIGGPKTAQISSGTLGTWSGLLSLPSDLYVIRLVVTTTDGKQYHDMRYVAIEPASRAVIPSNGDQFGQDIDGDNMVYSDNRYGQYDVFLYDLAKKTEKRLTSGGSRNLVPKIAGNRVIWYETSLVNQFLVTKIMHYDIATGIKTEIPAVSPPGTVVLSERGIAWQKNQSYEVQFYDFTTKTTRKIGGNGNIIPIYLQGISGNKVLWFECPIATCDPYDYSHQWDAYIYDVNSSTLSKTFNLVFVYSGDIDGNNIVFTDDPDLDSKFDVYLYDLSSNTERRLTTTESVRSGPRIGGNRIAWLEYRNENYDISLYDLRTGVQSLITSQPWTQGYLALATDRWLVWMDERNDPLVRANLFIQLAPYSDITPFSEGLRQTGRLTSTGQNAGTLAGTAGGPTALSSVDLYIREKNDPSPVCNPNLDRDWNGTGWIKACQPAGLLKPAIKPVLPATKVVWSYSSTPQVSQMIDGKTYRIYYRARDAYSNPKVGDWKWNDAVYHKLTTNPASPL